MAGADPSGAALSPFLPDAKPKHCNTAKKGALRHCPKPGRCQHDFMIALPAALEYNTLAYMVKQAVCA